jgi:hypothetical protein
VLGSRIPPETILFTRKQGCWPDITAFLRQSVVMASALSPTHAQSGLQLELACLPAYRMTSLGLTSLLARHQFGKAILDELHKRFGWIPLHDHMNHSVEDQKAWIELEEGCTTASVNLFNSPDVYECFCFRMADFALAFQLVVTTISLFGRSPRVYGRARLRTFLLPNRSSKCSNTILLSSSAKAAVLVTYEFSR